MYTYNFWVFRNKLLGVLVLLTEAAEATFSKEDYNAILYGIDFNEHTNYTFVCQQEFTIGFAKDSDSDDVIHLQIQTSDASLVLQITAIDSFQCYFTDWTVQNQDYYLE